MKEGCGSSWSVTPLVEFSSASCLRQVRPHLVSYMVIIFDHFRVFLTSKNIETLKYRFETLKYRLGSLSVIGYSVDRMQASTRHALYLWPNLVSFPR